ncbi:MAG: zf-HC2 domain-containing protein [Gemmatimonadaceae bacterium]
MMNDCQNVAVREVLPELAHGALSDVERERVQEHLDACADCAAELAIIRSVLRTAPLVSVNVASIAAAIPPYRRKSSGMKRVYMELAAACLIGAVGLSAFAIHNSRSEGPATAPAATNAGGLAIVNTSDLSDDGLAQLTQDLDNLQAMPSADPESVTPAVLEQLVPLGVVGDTQ